MTKSSSHSSIHSAFTHDYVGNCHQVFVDTLNRYNVGYPTWDRSELYSKSIAVVQSSGTGKSRMIQEASTILFTIPINIRERVAGVTSYPPPDDSIRKYFDNPGSKTDKRLQIEYAILLGEVFRHTLEIIKSEPFSQSENLPEDWANYLFEGQTTAAVGNNRQQYYETIKKNAEAQHKDIPNDDDGTVIGFMRRLETQCALLIEEIRSRVNSSRRLVCLVSFDEAHSLTSPRKDFGSEKIRSAYHNLEKVLKNIRLHPIFFVFLSTNSSLHQFAPTPANHPSARSVYLDGQKFLPPYTELPFDIFSKDHLANIGPLTLEKMHDVTTMSAFGRGLWYTHHSEWQALQKKQAPTQGPGPDSNIDIQPVIELAMNKLMFTPGSEKGLLAAFGIRLGLNFNPSSPDAREIESVLVERHMRFAIAVPEHRAYMWTCAPSEPILAEAAGHTLDMTQRAPELARLYFGRGIMARGERGEVVGRMLWTGAHDMVLPMRGDRTRPAYHLPIKVLDLLKSLLHPSLHHIVLSAKPLGDPNGVELQVAFQDAYVFFSHFAVADDQEMLHVDNMYTALLRGMALQGGTNQRSIDAVIPIHMGKVTDEISPKTTSAINIQFKNRQDCRNVYVDRSITIPDNNTPVLSVIMELGDSRANNRQPKVAVQTSLNIPKHLLSDPDYDRSQEDKHYSIVAYGHGPETYQVIPEGMETTYGEILASAVDPVDDFPRSKFKDNLDIMYNIKPFFQGKADSRTFGWVERKGVDA